MPASGVVTCSRFGGVNPHRTGRSGQQPQTPAVTSPHHDGSRDISPRSHAILLVLLYGQSPKRIVSLRCEDLVSSPDGCVHLRLGRDPVVLLPPVANLATQLQQGRSSTVPLRDVASPWLFPGHSPGRHLHPTSLSRRLKELGVPARPGHNSTLLDLAQSAPTAVLADLLGLHPSTVEAWSNASAARWAYYVAADPPERT